MEQVSPGLRDARVGGEVGHSFGRHGRHKRNRPRGLEKHQMKKISSVRSIVQKTFARVY